MVDTWPAQERIMWWLATGLQLTYGQSVAIEILTRFCDESSDINAYPWLKEDFLYGKSLTTFSHALAEKKLHPRQMILIVIQR